MGPGEIDRRVELRRDARRQRCRLTLRRLQLHQNRAEPLREVVVNVAREAIPLLERRLAPLLETAALDDAVVMERQRRLPCDGFDQLDAPPLRVGALGERPGRQLDPSEIRGADDERRHDHDFDALDAMEFAHGLGESRVLFFVLDGRGPSGHVRHQMVREQVVRKRQRLEVAAAPHVQAIAAVRHPQLAPLLIVVEQPHGARVALGVFDHRLGQSTEESFDVRLADEQIERELHDFRLHRRQTVRALPRVVLAYESRAENVGISRRRFGGRGSSADGAVGPVWFHRPIIEQTPCDDIVQKY